MSESPDPLHILLYQPTIQIHHLTIVSPFFSRERW